MILTRRLAALLGSGTLALGGSSFQPSNAAPPPAVFKDSAGNVYVHTGVTTGARVDVDLVGAPLTKKIRAGYCGQITLSPSASIPDLGNSVTISGTNINLTTITATANPPSCTGNTFTPATTTPFKLSNGRVVLPGYTAGTSYDVKLNDLPAKASTTVNACSFATIRNTVAKPLPDQIKINGTAYTVASLPVANPPICQRNSDTGVSTRYVPASW